MHTPRKLFSILILNKLESTAEEKKREQHAKWDSRVDIMWRMSNPTQHHELLHNT